MEHRPKIVKTASPAPLQFEVMLQAVGLSDAECARYVEVEPRTLMRWKRGQRQILPAAWEKLCWLDGQQEHAANEAIARAEFHGQTEIAIDIPATDDAAREAVMAHACKSTVA